MILKHSKNGINTRQDIYKLSKNIIIFVKMPYKPRRSERPPKEQDDNISGIGFMGEVIGTFAICFIGGLCGLSKDLHNLNYTDLAVCNGLMVTLMVYCFIHYSGAHFNPAISIAFLISGHVS